MINEIILHGEVTNGSSFFLFFSHREMGDVHGNDTITNQRHHLNSDDDPVIPATVEDGNTGDGGGTVTVVEQKPSSSSLIRKLRFPSRSRKSNTKSSSSSSSSYMCGLGCFGTPPNFSADGGEGDGMSSLRVPDVVPSAADDCQRLKKAFEGWGTDEKAVIKILGHRNANQRRKIRDAYQQLYNKSFIDDLQSELSGDFRKAIIWWTYDPPERDARLAKEAMQKRKKGIKHLLPVMEIACATVPQHLIAVRQAYRSLHDCSNLRATFDVYKQDYGTTIDEDIRKCRNGDLESLLKVMVCCIGTPKKHFVEVVRTAIVGLGTDEDSLSRAIVARAGIDLMKVREDYSNMYRVSLDNDVIGDTSGDYRNFFLLTVLGTKDLSFRHLPQLSCAAAI